MKPKPLPWSSSDPPPLRVSRKGLWLRLHGEPGRLSSEGMSYRRFCALLDEFERERGFPGPGRDGCYDPELVNRWLNQPSASAFNYNDNKSYSDARDDADAIIEISRPQKTRRPHLLGKQSAF